MKHFIILALLFISINACSQKQTLDIITFTAPDGWESKPSDKGIQLIKEDSATGAYCLILIYKSMPATGDAKENFNVSWTSLMKDMMQVENKPEMASSEQLDGWDVLSGHASFEREDIKGVGILVNASGFGKMVNIIIVTNSDAYEKNISEFLESVHLEKPAAEKNKNASVVKPESQPATKDGYAFNTTNFDDGWTSTVQEDWVEATKGNTRVLIHYPNPQLDKIESDLDEKIKNGWNNLVAPRYNSIGTVEYKRDMGWQPIDCAEADAVDNATGKRVHIVLFRKGNPSVGGKYIEFITPDKNAFVREFGEPGSDWDKLAAMANYNKFAVAASDLAGKWTNNFTGSISYVNAYTGSSAGMDAHSSRQNFHFQAGNKYNWEIAVASGFVGNQKFQGAKSAGKFSMVNNWQIHFSDIEGKARTYDIAFVCVKGVRLLWIDGTAYGRE